MDSNYLKFNGLLNEPNKVEIDSQKFQAQYNKDVSVELYGKMKNIISEEFYDWDKLLDLQIPPTLIHPSIDEKFFEVKPCLFKNPNQENNYFEVASDSPKLDKEQLNSLREIGELTVENSVTKTKDVWRMNKFLQKGKQNVRNSLNSDFSNVLLLSCIWVRNRIIGKRFSLFHAIRSFFEGFIMLLDLLFGLPHNNFGDINLKLAEERELYRLCELTCKGKENAKLLRFWDQFERLIRLSMCKRDKFLHKISWYNQPDISPYSISVRTPPYQFVTPSKFSLDLRHFNQKFKESCVDAIENIKSEVLKNWYPSFKEECVFRLKNEGLSSQSLVKALQLESNSRFKDEIFKEMKNDSVLNMLSPTIAETLIANAQFSMLCDEVKTSIFEKWSLQREAYKSQLQSTNPIFSLVKQWMNERLAKFDKNYALLNNFEFHHTLINLCNDNLEDCAGLAIFVYFLQRDLDFLENRYNRLKQALVQQTFPDKHFVCKLRYVLRKHWKVVKVHDSTSRYSSSDDSQNFKLIKGHDFTVSTRYCFWRWWHLAVFCYCNTLNLTQLFLIAIPFGSCVGLSALFRPKQFFPRWEFDSKDGRLSKNLHKPVNTFSYNLRRLWRFIASRRRKFESRVMTGLLDKSFARPFHMLWFYVIIGFCGSLLFIIIMPPLCLIVGLGSIFLGLTCPIWGILASVGWKFLQILFYDTMTPCHRKITRLFPLFVALFKILVFGLLQAIFIPFLILSILILALLTLFWACWRFSVRTIWDGFLFNVVIKRKARIPLSDDWVCRKISGSINTSSYYYRVSIDQIIFAFCLRLETVELELWRQQWSEILSRPVQNVQNYYKSNFSEFSLIADVSSGFLSGLFNAKDARMAWIDIEHKRRADILRNVLYSTDSYMNVRSKIKMTENELNEIFIRCEQILSEFYTHRFLPRLIQIKSEKVANEEHSEKSESKIEQNWWKINAIEVRDYSSLVAHYLQEIFSENFFISLEETDRVTQLSIEHIDMEVYFKMISGEIDLRDDLDEFSLKVDKSRAKLYSKYFYKVMDPSFSNDLFFITESTQMPNLKVNKIKIKSRRVWHRPRFWCFKKTRNVLPDNNLFTISKYSAPYISGSLNFPVYHPAVIALLLHLRDRESFRFDYDLERDWIGRYFNGLKRLSLTEDTKIPMSSENVVLEGNPDCEIGDEEDDDESDHQTLISTGDDLSIERYETT